MPSLEVHYRHDPYSLDGPVTFLVVKEEEKSEEVKPAAREPFTSRRGSVGTSSRSPSIYSLGNSSTADSEELPSLYPSAGPSHDNLTLPAQGFDPSVSFDAPVEHHPFPLYPHPRYPQHPPPYPALPANLALRREAAEVAPPFGWGSDRIPPSATYHSGFALPQPPQFQPQPPQQQQQQQQQPRRYVHYSGYSAAPRWLP
eukprot:RCo012542